jgi:hypothetical protein
MPRLVILKVQEDSEPGLDAGTGYRGMAILLETDPRIPVSAPALLLYNGSTEGEIYPGLVAALGADGQYVAGDKMLRRKAEVTTSDATVTTLFSKTLATDSAYRIIAKIVARRTDGTAARAKYVREALVYRISSTATLQGSVQLPVADIESDANWDATIDVSSNDVRVRITGIAKVAATRTIQSLLYTAKTAGVGGNDITIRYIGGGTAGAELVSVLGSAITVTIESGVSTATNIITAIAGNVAANALVTPTVAGGAAGGDTQTTQAVTNLTGGVTPTINWLAEVEIQKV